MIGERLNKKVLGKKDERLSKLYQFYHDCAKYFDVYEWAKQYCLWVLAVIYG